MIICSSSKYIFVHVPKTAGSSVSKMLTPSLKAGDIRLTGDMEKNRLKIQQFFGVERSFSQHVTVGEISKGVGCGFSDYRKLVIVRNPYARAYSCYKYRRLREGIAEGPPPEKPEVSSVTFEEFICDPKYRSAYSMLMRPQIDWVRNLDRFFLGKTETLKRDMLNFLYLMDIETRGINFDTKINVSSTTGGWENMSSRAEAEIRRLYKHDFERFEYAM